MGARVAGDGEVRVNLNRDPELGWWKEMKLDAADHEERWNKY